MHLTLHLTPSCNMRCDYCYAPPQPGEAMSEATAARALQLGASIGSGSCGVIFFGGEPLLQRDLIEATVSHARALERQGKGRFHFKATTNGLLLDDAFLEFAVREEVLVAMSFDGVREAQDRHRKLADGTGSYDVLLSRLVRLLEVRPYSSVLLVVSPDTAPLLSQSVQLLLELGCRYLVVSLDHAAGWSEQSLGVLQEQYERLAKLYVEWTRAGRKFYLSPFEVKLASHIHGSEYRKERCELGRRQVSVAPDGSLYPCVQFTRAGRDSAWCIGDVQRGIDEPARAAIRMRAEQQKEPCRSCAIESRCNNTCGCLNWQSTGNVNVVSPVLCRHEQMLLPIVDKVGAQLYQARNPLFLHKHYNPAFPVLSLLDDASRFDGG
ncbi:MAG: radical SAM protein [Deltaproteobacteria bacterium]|nr:radical SAM protein [Deltaproteobacteria bacterium]